MDAFDVPPRGLPDLARHARLASLTPVEAVRAFVEGDVAPGEETALGFAIRSGGGVSLSDDALFDALAPSMGTGADPAMLLDTLRRASRGR